MMSAVVFDVGYDIRMIKTRENMVTVRLLKNFARYRSPKKFQDFEEHWRI